MGQANNFDLDTSHVLPALIRKAHDARMSDADEMVVWGSGKPQREFLYVDDCADALVKIMTEYLGFEHINLGLGKILPSPNSPKRLLGSSVSVVSLSLTQASRMAHRAN